MEKNGSAPDAGSLPDWHTSRARPRPIKCLGTPSAVHATVILGLEGVSSNTNGQLSFEDDALIFRRMEGQVVRIPMNSIDDVYLSQEDKEVGGTPMALGRAAAPYGGGRVIGLVAHEKI